MSKERELLVRIYRFLKSNVENDFGLGSDIRELLTHPEQEQEPVAWIIQTEVEGKLLEWVCTDKKHYMEEHDGTKDPIPLYLAPPKREPLSSIKILELTSKHEYAINLIRAVEKAHGIGEG